MSTPAFTFVTGPDPASEPGSAGPRRDPDEIRNRVPNLIDVVVVVAKAAEHDVGTGPANESVVAVAALQNVAVAAAVEIVIPPVAVEVVRHVIADEMVVAAAAFRVLDVCALGDGNVLGQPADVGELTVAQPDPLVLGVAREVEGILAARIPHGEHDLLAGVVDVERLAIGVGVEAVGGVAGARRHVGPVEALDGGDVVQERRGAVDHPRAVDVVGTGLRGLEVAHHRILPAVLDVFGVGGIGYVDVGAGVVVARMLKPKGVADLVNQRGEAVGAERDICVGRIVLVDPHVAGIGIRSRSTGRRIMRVRTRAIVYPDIVGKQDGAVVRIGRKAGGAEVANEGDVCHIGPES